MAKYVGQCIGCGSNNSPKGNVFRLMSGAIYDIDFPHKPEAPTETVKVCNNCNTAHPFHPRQSKQRQQRETTMAWLLGE